MNFFVDPAMVRDKDARGITHIAVSYTFYPVAAPGGVAQKPAASRAEPTAQKRSPRNTQEHLRAPDEDIRWPKRTPRSTTTITS